MVPMVEKGISETTEIGQLLRECLEAHPLYFKSTRDRVNRFSDSIKMCVAQLRDPDERANATKIFENISQILYINNLVNHCRPQ